MPPDNDDLLFADDDDEILFSDDEEDDFEGVHIGCVDFLIGSLSRIWVSLWE